MGSRSKRQRAVSAPVFHEVWLPGQKEYIPKFMQTWKDIFAGDVSSPTARMLQQQIEESTMRDIAAQRQAIAETKGMTAPAKAKAIEKLSSLSAQQTAQIPQALFGQAKDILSAYTLQPPTVSTGAASRSSGGGGWSVCCFIFLAASKDDEELAYVRRFKDTFFDIDSTVAQGYKKLAIHLVPLMERSNLVREMVRWCMVKPVQMYAKGFYEDIPLLRYLSYPIAKLWVTVYKLIGTLFGRTSWASYFTLGGRR